MVTKTPKGHVPNSKATSPNISIPTYDLKDFRHEHRQATNSIFGYNNLAEEKRIPGFEIYSSEGLLSSVGPMRSLFFRVSICVTGALDMKIGLEDYDVRERSMSFTYPNQIFAKNNIRPGSFGYYILFSAEFLADLISPSAMGDFFPFYAMDGLPIFTLTVHELQRVIRLIEQIDDELQRNEPAKNEAIKMYLYLLLIEAKRSYEKQGRLRKNISTQSSLTHRFRKLVSMHYLSRRQVSDYADMLAVTPNHLNKIVKSETGRTASDAIRDMLILESMSLLKYTDKTIAEIAYDLSFSEPATFNRFFKTAAGTTPQTYRKKHKPANIMPD